MILAGDEFGNTQGGNNNAYCQNSEIAWINWNEIDDDGYSLIEFVRQAVACANPILCWGCRSSCMGMRTATLASRT